MAAPIIVILNREYANQVAYHLYGEVYLDKDVDQLLDALIAAAVDSGVAESSQPDLFGGS